MAYDNYLEERIKRILNQHKVNFSSKKMMGGLTFMVDEKMLSNIHFNKKREENLLMIRIGAEAFEKHIQKSECLPMDFKGRAIKGFMYVTPDGYDLDEDLEYWIQLALDYNPIAKGKK